jgi:polyisoprenoid-binding protein YceI
MVLRFALSAAVVLSSSLVGICQDTLKLDKQKSKIEFVGSKPAEKSSHSGGFKEFSAESKVDWEAPEKSTLKIEIKADSLFSDDAKLTDHLKNPDFFDVKKNPTITFESTKIEPNEEEGVITGKMTMLGKTVEQQVPYKVEVTDTEVILKADFKLDRTKWGMKYGVPKVSEQVEIKATLSFKRPM